MFAKKLKYQIKILTYFLSAKEKNNFAAKDVSSKLNIPKEYTAKLMKEMRIKGLMKSKKGKGGGFILSPKIMEISMNELLVQLGFKQNEKRLLGLDEFTQDSCCPFCEIWKEFKVKLNEVGYSSAYKSLSKKFIKK